MSVSIDRVYQTVLTIVNKEGFDYVTPQEFNLLANQAQIEIFEEYFRDEERLMLQGRNDSDYTDGVRNLDEKISFFYARSTSIVDTDWVNYPDDMYRLGIVASADQMSPGVHMDEVSQKDALYITLSPLTSPTRKQPVYTRNECGITVYPSTLTSVNMIYLRRPAEVAWRGTVDAASGQFVVGGSTDFELHPSEFPELVVKILSYIGIMIKAADIAQFAENQEATITQNES